MAGVHGNRMPIGRNSALDSSYAEESETEYSDEDVEHVYYVSNSHQGSLQKASSHV